MTRIDSVSQSPDRAGRYLVKFSDGTSVRLYRQTVEDFRMYPGMEIEDLQTLRDHDSRYSAKMRAVRIISASSVSKRDLENRLVRKGESEEQAKAAAKPAGTYTIHGEGDEAIDALVMARYEAKKAKNFAEADRIRDELKAQGIEVTDVAGGANWKRI